MQKLNPITHPLNSVSLIEASAGTGKTYTMVALYLRLLLNAGENGLSRALTVEQILVMTFTEAATQELKDRIRTRIVEVKGLFNQVLQQQLAEPPSQDPFILDLFHAVKADLPSAVLRLELAQQDMDTAAIFTIHGFCYRMLMRYAFDSGVHFNLELQTQDDDLLLRFCREYWREQFYSQNLAISRFIATHLKSPEEVLKRIKADLSGEMPQVRSDFTQGDLNAFLQHHLMAHLAQIARFKADWLAQHADIQALILQAMQQKQLDGRSYQTRYIEPAFEAIAQWANGSDSSLHEKLIHYFSQQKLDQKSKGAAEISHDLFQQVDQLAATDEAFFAKMLLWHYIHGVRAKIAAHKASHKEMGFGDLLQRLKTALYAENGQSLAQLIRQQFPFAMIDEFQDTDLEQYQIFKRLYLDQADSRDSGMIMIGDPKQSIYAFRNADIFTYLTAAEQAQQRFTLDTNWRSTPQLIAAVNKLFAHAATPFIYPQIQFQAVNAGKSAVQLHLNGVQQKPLNVMLSEDDKSDMATACAASIQQWLKGIEQGEVRFSDPNLTLAAKDLAVLVRNVNEAKQVKQALANLGIQSVYLSDRSSVLESDWAQAISYLLAACLNPQQESTLMKVLASRLFQFNAQQLSQLRQDERAWERWIRDFSYYQRLWQTQGVLPMIHRLLQQQKLVAKLLAMPDGERAITDILHLAEFLQQGASLNENEHALLSWFETMINNHDPEADEVRLRLESERNLVKIVTIHKSKGLEYGVVWLPFLGSGFAKKKGESQRLQRYHDGQNQLCYDLDDSHQQENLQERLAEELRLLYVALTRARYQLNIGFPTKLNTKSNWNALAYLLSDNAMLLQAKNNLEWNTAAQLSRYLADDDYSLTALSDLQADDWRAAVAQAETLEAANFDGQIEQNWTVGSFTALAAMQQRNQQRRQNRQQPSENSLKSEHYHDSGADYDSEHLDFSLWLNQPSAQIELKQWQGQIHNPFTLPQGAKVGNVLHHWLQYADFSQAPSAEALPDLCRQLNLAADEWLAPLQYWLQQLYQTPFLTTAPFGKTKVRLADLPAQDCLKEMAFMISMDAPLNVPQLNRLLRQYHPLAAQQAPLQLDQIQGMLRGFIDLVCRVSGKYYLIDYKSNYLGEGYQAYQSAQLANVIAYQRYDLQYLIYTLALHRYLQQRDPHYDYQRDFGGVYYLFLRGMDGVSSDSGVYFDKPDWSLIDGLDKLLVGAV
ncbi:exodeoxyribonuclease V subunit beta [Testudinibacter sp. P80/BLE/0925]|uniref:exodeoxyribonuclease V subunit beta n=1 Tax=Testudinibacter sp. TW-1 TaxID=3417757 RepID=UPI003D3632A5